MAHTSPRRTQTLPVDRTSDAILTDLAANLPRGWPQDQRIALHRLHLKTECMHSALIILLYVPLMTRSEGLLLNTVTLVGKLNCWGYMYPVQYVCICIQYVLYVCIPVARQSASIQKILVHSLKIL